MRALTGLVALAAVLVAGCSPSTPAETSAPAKPSTPGPFITLHAPETATADASVEIVVDSAGHVDEEAQLYVFRTDYDAKADCANTGVQPTIVKLSGGPQTVSLETTEPGDMWLVLTTEGLETECGETKIRALINPLPEVGPGCEGEGSAYHCPEEWPAYQAGDEFTYRVQSAVPPEGVPLAVKVAWVGPFATAPKAQASPCQVTPEESVDELELLRDGEAGRGATINGDPTGGAQLKKVLKEPGIYRVMLSVAETEFTAGYEASCEDAALVTVK